MTPLPTDPAPKPSFTSSGLFIALLVGGTLVVSGVLGIGVIAALVVYAEPDDSWSSYDDPYAYGNSYGDQYAYDDTYRYDDDYGSSYDDPYAEPVFFGGVTEAPSTVHARTGARWSDESPYAMSWSEAAIYCLSQSPVGTWRLPTRAELESLAGPSGQLDEPFRSTSTGGYLWSSEEVPGRPGHPWIMNQSNGHVFNGHGYEGSVRCVRY